MYFSSDEILGKSSKYHEMATDLLEKSQPVEVVSAILKYSFKNQLDASTYKEIKPSNPDNYPRKSSSDSSRSFRRDRKPQRKFGKSKLREKKGPERKFRDSKKQSSFKSKAHKREKKQFGFRKKKRM